MDFKPISGPTLKLGLVDPHRLLTWVWSTPKQAIPLILYPAWVLSHFRGTFLRENSFPERQSARNDFYNSLIYKQFHSLIYSA